MTHKIMVPLDGSSTAEAIMPHLARLIFRHESEVILVRTENPPPTEDYANQLELALLNAERYLAFVKARLAAQEMAARTIVRAGSAARTLVQISEEEGISLIAMTTHGRTGLSRLLMGSVAEEIFRACPAPVFSVRPFWDYDLAPPPAADAPPIGTVLVAMDGDRMWRSVVPVFVEFARRFGAKVLLLHVFDPGKGTPTAEEKARILSDLDEAAGLFREHGLTTDLLTRGGEPAGVILDIARNAGADLVAMASRGQSRFPRLLIGSVAERVFRGSRIPVLVSCAA